MNAESGERRRIVFLGTHGQHNIGDELLLEVFLWQLGAQHSYVINSYDPVHTRVQLQDRYDVEVIDTAGDRLRFLRHLLGCDLVCFGGGSIVKELYRSTGRSRYATLLMILATVTFANLVARKPIAMLNIGVGPIGTRRGRFLARLILSQVDELSVRDQGSHETCLTAGLSSASVRLGTDAVFSVDAAWLLGPTESPAPDSSERPGTERAVGPRRRIALNLNIDIENAANWEPFLATLADGLLRLHARCPIELHGLPMQSAFKPNDDARVLAAFAERIPDIPMVHHTPKTHVEAARIIAGCDLVLSERLHAIVIASVLGTPCFALSYDVKVRELAVALGLERFTVDVNQAFDPQLMAMALTDQLADLDGARRDIVERREQLSTVARDHFDRARRWLGSL